MVEPGNADLHVDSDVNGGTRPGHEIAGLKFSTIFVLRRVFFLPTVMREAQEREERKLLIN
jgi:hypothetical protein